MTPNGTTEPLTDTVISRVVPLWGATKKVNIGSSTIQSKWSLQILSKLLIVVRIIEKYLDNPVPS